MLALGGAAVAASAVIHLHLWMDGYSSIRTIGPLFLAQAVAGLVMAVAVILLRRVWIALLALGYLLATIAGFLVSVNVGFAGFQDTWAAPFARTAFWVEVAGSAVMIVGAGSCAFRAWRHPAGPLRSQSLEDGGNIRMGSGAGAAPR